MCLRFTSDHFGGRSHTVGGEKFVMMARIPNSKWKYFQRLILNSKSACFTQVALPADEAGLSAGATFLVIFGSLFAAYLLGGMAIMKFIKGAQGVEIIPNYEFWASLPSLVKVMISNSIIKSSFSLIFVICIAGWILVCHFWLQRCGQLRQNLIIAEYDSFGWIWL